MATKQETTEARERLTKLLTTTTDKPTIYTVLRHVSSSGMSRDISVKMVSEDGQLIDITYTVAQALGMKLYSRHGQNVVCVKGTGQDMGYALVYEISATIFHGQDRAGYKVRHEWA